jgi:hypothetical protein
VCLIPTSKRGLLVPLAIIAAIIPVSLLTAGLVGLAFFAAGCLLGWLV